MAALVSRLVSRFDPRWIAGTGAILATGALWYLTRLTTASSYTGSLLPSMAILGVGMGLIFLPLTFDFHRTDLQPRSRSRRRGLQHR